MRKLFFAALGASFAFTSFPTSAIDSSVIVKDVAPQPQVRTITVNINGKKIQKQVTAAQIANFKKFQQEIPLVDKKLETKLINAHKSLEDLLNKTGPLKQKIKQARTLLEVGPNQNPAQADAKYTTIAADYKDLFVKSQNLYKAQIEYQHRDKIKNMLKTKMLASIGIKIQRKPAPANSPTAMPQPAQ